MMTKRISLLSLFFIVSMMNLKANAYAEDNLDNPFYIRVSEQNTVYLAKPLSINLYERLDDDHESEINLRIKFYESFSTREPDYLTPTVRTDYNFRKLGFKHSNLGIPRSLMNPRESGKAFKVQDYTAVRLHRTSHGNDVIPILIYAYDVDTRWVWSYSKDISYQDLIEVKPSDLKWENNTAQYTVPYPEFDLKFQIKRIHISESKLQALSKKRDGFLKRQQKHIQELFGTQMISIPELRNLLKQN